MEQDNYPMVEKLGMRDFSDSDTMYKRFTEYE
jgi:hypothetical protein